MHLSSSFAEGRFAGLFLALLLACATLYGPQTRAQQASDQAGEPANEAASEVGRAEVSVFLFKGGAPEPGLALYQGDTLLGRSDSEGAVFARIRAGQSVLEVRRDGQTIYEHSVNAAADDYIQLIITLCHHADKCKFITISFPAELQFGGSSGNISFLQIMPVVI